VVVIYGDSLQAGRRAGAFTAAIYREPAGRIT